MMLILAILAVLSIHDVRKFIKAKESFRVIATYTFIAVLSLILGFLISIGKRPSSPAEWIQKILQAIGVIK
ncbi:putative membrane protein YqhA [Caldicoprobacter guelmensis]|uniref:hypothetical protein n=1 Tax=Caldicoprobacter guelmensis TaxID=1170224 RepID=UPI00195BAB85|nr:hypothetical protein [Caldicoprobacter guelmensis]MBM7581534.1 putative membrane protein YqhA [Caldicoprobacter guelmensis]